jgi:putative ABC transport system substrate-binding protein
MRLVIKEVNASSREELERVIRTITRKEADAILLQPDAFFAKNIEVVIQQSLKEKLPVIPTLINNVKRGGLATYSPDYFTLGQQGAALVNRILRGAKPADLPIEQPLKLVLAINLKTAKAIGLKISKEILLRADKVIE